ncbi:hypothetical protein RUM44_006216 [Polyplax serrata]|uniref:Uncharacterized protein n=1 Tax=Polyplax serrata TaxID=468196 RepID=A0ABR1AHH3_POLSC
MTNTRSCHHNMNIPVMFWTSVFLLLLARGVCCTEEQSKFERFSKFEPETDVDGYTTPDVSVTSRAGHFAVVLFFNF